MNWQDEECDHCGERHCADCDGSIIPGDGSSVGCRSCRCEPEKLTSKEHAAVARVPLITCSRCGTKAVEFKRGLCEMCVEYCEGMFIDSRDAAPFGA